ncbi:thiamine phosphate synthase [uncultured Anaerococcus sp.]|uniref:thiamine phosphate synthase n=1 Tax=uncultured Anaerococcus sp. TaxID=293428 RepID=UPI00260F7498|nr:thiamine phosphate synthase [uncultured Anaerococcus sp.]
MKDFDLSLYLVTNRDKLSDAEFFKVIEDSLKGGVSLVQLREKTAPAREIIEIAKKLKEICHSYKVPLLVDDRVDIALAADLDGVHLGNEDMDVADARRILGADKIIGSTAKDLEWAISEEKKGADYLGVGAIFETKTHVKTKRTSLETLREINDNIKIPTVAIGGLNYDNIDILKGSKAKGVSVVRAIMDSRDPYEDSKKLKEKIIYTLDLN